jgi:hypothetical protein
MAGVRFTELQSRPMEFLDVTSVTLDAFPQLVPPFEAAFHARMAAWRMDGKPRTARRFTVYKNCPLPTPADRLLFILVYLKTSALQVVQGRLFGMVQGKANQLDARPPARPPRGVAHPRRCSRPFSDGPGAAARRLGDRCGHGGRTLGGGASAPDRGTRRRAGVPPLQAVQSGWWRRPTKGLGALERLRGSGVGMGGVGRVAARVSGHSTWSRKHSQRRETRRSV